MYKILLLYTPGISDRTTKGRREKGNAGSGGYGDFVSRIRFPPDVPDMDKWKTVAAVQAVYYTPIFTSLKIIDFFFTLQRLTGFLNIFYVTVQPYT